MRNLTLSILVIIALGFAVYANSLGGKFVWDDNGLVRDNLYIKSGANAANVFTQNIAAGVGLKVAFYRPLQMFTYMTDYSLWKLNPFGYHLTNMLFHIAAALCVFWLINILFGNNLLSLLTAALFVVHPVHTEAISYISGRADPMALTFMLLAFVFYIKIGTVPQAGVTTRWGLSLFLCSLFYTLALLSRENSLILLLLIPLYHYTFRKKIEFKKILPILIITAAYLSIRAAVLKGAIMPAAFPTTLAERLPGFFAGLTNYIGILLLPINLHMEYGLRLFSFSDPKVILGAAILISAIIYALIQREKNRIVFFAIFWFILTLLPQSNLYPINAYMAEHWLYLPSVGVFLVVAGASNLVISNQVRKVKLTNLTWLDITRLAITAGGILALIAFWSILTIRQNNYWRDPATLYKRTLVYAPNSVKILHLLGDVYYSAGNMKNAAGLYEKVIVMDPKYADAYNNLGNVYHAMGDNEKAKEFYKKAIDADSRCFSAYCNLGNIYNDAGKEEDAVIFYKKAAELEPGHWEVYHNLGIAYSALGKNEEAAAAYRKADQYKK